MRAFDLALFMFIVLGCVSFLEATLPTDTSITTATATSWTTEKLSETVYEMDFSQHIAVISLKLIEAAFYSIAFFLLLLVKSTVLIPIVLNDLGIAPTFTAIITGCVWFTYATAVFQIWTGKSIRGSE